MPHKMNDRDFLSLRKHIEIRGKPLFFENESGRFALVLTENGKRRFLNEGFIAITVNELKSWIKDCQSFNHQQKVILQKARNLAEGFEVASKVRELFEGTIRNLE